MVEYNLKQDKSVSTQIRPVEVFGSASSQIETD